MYPDSSKRKRPYRAPTSMESLLTSTGPVFRHVPNIIGAYDSISSHQESMINGVKTNASTMAPLCVPEYWNYGVATGVPLFNTGPQAVFWQMPQSRYLTGFGNTNYNKIFLPWLDPLPAYNPQPVKWLWEFQRHRVLNYIHPVDFYRPSQKLPDIMDGGYWTVGPGNMDGICTRPSDYEHIEMLHLDIHLDLYSPRSSNTATRCAVFLLYTEAHPYYHHLQRRVNGSLGDDRDPVTKPMPCKVPLCEDYNYTDCPNGPVSPDPSLYDSRNRVTIVKRWDFVFPPNVTQSVTSAFTVATEGEEGGAPTATASEYPEQVTINGPAILPNDRRTCLYSVNERVPLNLLASYDVKPYWAQDPETDPEEYVQFSPYHSGLYDGMLSLVIVTDRNPAYADAIPVELPVGGRAALPDAFYQNAVTGDLTWTLDYRQIKSPVIFPRDN